MRVSSCVSLITDHKIIHLGGICCTCAGG